MKTLVRKFITLSLVITTLTLSPLFLFAQNKLTGELLITKISADGFVSVNGEQAASGRSITSASEIVTSPQANAKVLLPQTGTVLIAPNSRLNLSFVSSSISGDLTSGEITIETAPNTTLNFLTPDGTITLPVTNQANVIKVKVEKNKTQIQTLTGQANFNNISIPAGEFYPLNSGAPAAPAANAAGSSAGFNPLVIVGLLGAVGVVALVALAGGSKDSSSPPVVSPTR